MPSSFDHTTALSCSCCASSDFDKHPEGKKESYTVVTVLSECLTSQTSCSPANSGVKFRPWALVPNTAKQCDTTSTASAGAHTHRFWTRLKNCSNVQTHALTHSKKNTVKFRELQPGPEMSLCWELNFSKESIRCSYILRLVLLSHVVEWPGLHLLLRSFLVIQRQMWHYTWLSHVWYSSNVSYTSAFKVKCLISEQLMTKKEPETA